MGIQDLFITPIYIILLSILALIVRPYVTTPENRRYFIPALWARFLGAMMLGVIYQFYYDGGDTFNYFTHGSRWIWEAFWEDPADGIKLLLADGARHSADTFRHSSRIWYYTDPPSMMIVRIAAFLDLFTFHTYSATAVVFAAFSFSGSWAMFTAVSKRFDRLPPFFAIALLFLPSTIIWGSGILKDTITYGALGWATFAALNLIYFRKIRFSYVSILLIAVLLIFKIKVYIILTFVGGLIVLIYYQNIRQIASQALRLMIAPVLALLIFFGGFTILSSVVADDNRYALNRIAETAAITNYDIRYGWGARTGEGAGFTIGTLDGSWGSMIRLAPSAINVSLFRPYLWEVRNPLMLLSALESAVMLVFTFLFFTSGWARIKEGWRDPLFKFAVVFAVTFAFAVGISTSNFGTLVRYKIPLMPFYITAIFIARNK